MSRPLAQSANATARDVSLLTRVLQRVTVDQTRDSAEKRQITGHLRGAIGLLMKWIEQEESGSLPAKNGHKEKPGREKSRLRAER